jgi:hypothetical protein
MPRYLTKSRFKLGLECVTKLYYTGKKEEYADQKIDDKFLLALAEGGYQVGNLSLFEFSESPLRDDIIIETLDYDDALVITNQKLSQTGRIVIAEAAFKFNNLFIRADIIVKNNNRIELYEVKSKSFDTSLEDQSVFISGKGDSQRVRSEWVPYLYDIAFQKYVISKSFPNYEIRSHLILVDKSKKATVDGLNQMFQIVKNDGRISVDISTITKDQLGDSILSIIPTDNVVKRIWDEFNVPTSLNRVFKFEEFIQYCENIYVNDHHVFAPITMECKNCTFKVKPEKDKDKKDGRIECWKHATNYSEDLLKKPWTVDVWQGRLDNALAEGKFLIEQLKDQDLGGNNEKNNAGLTQFARRKLQVEKIRNNDSSYYFNKVNFDFEIQKWKWPLNHIDFETSMVALPFYQNKSPYNGIAFQWSHHIMHEDGKIEHAGQYINFEKGVFPNLEFIRTLKISLSRNEGTIFRYHNHENNYLRMIHEQISSGEIEVNEQEKNELLNFIDLITRYKPDGKKYVSGQRDMVDLFQLVKENYYSPYSRGQVGLKYILPSIINDVPYLVEKYSVNGIYGKTLPIKSLNFEDHRWIDSTLNNDPYKTLPRIFEDYDRDDLDQFFEDLEGIGDGGSAMTAYAYLQYSHIPEQIRIRLRNALLRYCELDTMAMCFLIEGMMKLKNQI